LYIGVIFGVAVLAKLKGGCGSWYVWRVLK
jgi:hypothetical protein